MKELALNLSARLLNRLPARFCSVFPPAVVDRASVMLLQKMMKGQFTDGP